MAKKAKFNLERYITEQAVNFDKLAWNRKDINFALFWPIINTIHSIVVMVWSFIDGSFEVFDSVIWFLAVAVPLLYLCWKRYVFAMFMVTAWLGLINSFYIIFSVPGFYLAALVELYRRQHGLSKPQNIKKDVLVGTGLFLLFPILWGISLLWR